MWILTLINIVVARRRFVVLNTLLVTVLAAAISLLLPKEYGSKTTVLPPVADSGFGILGDISVSQIAHAVTSFSLPMMATPSDLYASMLKSDAVLKNVVDSLDLKTEYEVSSDWEAVAKLRRELSVRVELDGIISLEAVSRDPDLAARIANLTVRELNRLNLSFESKRSGSQANFLTSRVRETEAELTRVLEELREFQEEHMAISLELQSAALIENLARQKAELTGAEIELGMLRGSLGPDHPDLIRQRLIVQEMKSKLEETERGAGTRSDSIISALDIPLDDIPDLTLQFSVLSRNVRIQELLYEVLTQQLEFARIEQRRDIPVISVLDVARSSEEPFRPRKLRIVVSAFLLSFFASVLLAVAYERLSENREIRDQVAMEIKAAFTEIRRKPLG